MPQDEGKMLLASSPHFMSPVNSRRLMLNVIIALAPCAIYGVVLFGLPAAITIVVSIVSAVAAESLFRRIIKREVRAADLSAVVTGLLLALILPPAAPLWMTALGAAFAVIVAKEFFGGLGANVFNPALIGRAFLLMSFPLAIATWQNPSGGADAVSAVTPLGIIASGGSVSELGRSLAVAGLASGSDYASVIKTLFIGNHAGSIGESSILLICAGFIFLLATKTIDWRTPVSMITASFFFSLILGLDPLVSILSGGLVFGAVFMATDYATSPLTPKGKIIFGIGAGLITVLIRRWGTYPEGVTYGILIMNGVTPFLNRLLPKKYGFVPAKPSEGNIR